MKTLFKTFFLTLCLLFIIMNTEAQESKDKLFEEYKKQQQQNYKNYIDSTNISLQKYVQEEKLAFEKFKKEIEEYWGRSGFKSSTIKDWVEYSMDKKSRSDVDFERGTATVEILLTNDDVNNEDFTNKKLEEAVKNLVISNGSSKDFESEKEKPISIATSPVLEGQLLTKEGATVDSANTDLFVKEVVSSSKINQEIIRGDDGKERTKLTIRMSLAPNHILVRASKYENEINKYADIYNLPVELIYAVIHTESFFNPKATSAAPAYGLMQLVPSSGARDAYQFVYNKDKILTANYLFQADKNIELGSAYLKLQINRYFKAVTDKKSQLLCAIAAYNTGPGNVARAFTGNTNVNKAINKINGMNYDQLYNFLNNYLPYNETKEYIKKVNNRVEMYRGWRNDLN